MSLFEFLKGLPKAELHLHIEGSLEPELLFSLAQRNGISLKYQTIEELKQAYSFSNLQDFLDIYYEGANVLREEQDFYDLTWAYLKKIKEDGVIHTEIFFDPQTHTTRGIAFSTVIEGINRALLDGQKKLGVSSKIIMSFLRHLSEDEAYATLEEALDYKEIIAGVGLDSSEAGNPPSKFKGVFAKAREEGFLTVAHAGEEGPVEYVREALELLNVFRIDHGNATIKDDGLASWLVESQLPLTMCPLSNLALQVVKDLKEHPLKKMLDKGMKVTINSDDPAYFGGYINENYHATAQALNLSNAELCQLAKNSITGSLLPDDEKALHTTAIDAYFEMHKS